MNGVEFLCNRRYKITTLGSLLVISKKKWLSSYEWCFDQSTKKIQYNKTDPEFKSLKSFEFSDVEELTYEITDLPVEANVEAPERIAESLNYGMGIQIRKARVKLVLKSGEKVKVFYGTAKDGLRSGKIISKFLNIPLIWIRDIKKVALQINGIIGTVIGIGISLLIGSLFLSLIYLQSLSYGIYLLQGVFFSFGFIIVIACPPALAIADYGLFKLNKKREWHTREFVKVKQSWMNKK